MAEANDKDLLATARKRFAGCVSAHSNNRTLQLEDLRFFAASPDNGWQWPEKVKAAREGDANGPRPCLTINMAPQHVRQVTNEQRQNMPSIKVLPVDSQSDPEVAELMNGMIRHIQYHSDAETAYDNACESQVITGEGYWRILTEYCDETTFDQEILISPIRNHEAAYLEPYCDACGTNAHYGFIVQDLKEDEFKEKFPNAAPVQWDAVGNDVDYSNWYMEGTRTIRVAEYFYKEVTERELVLFGNGLIGFRDELPKGYATMLGEPVKTRRVMAERVKWCKLTGAEVLERTDWVGKYIPIVRVVGNEVEVEGEIYYYGLIRGMKDAQRMYNYWCSQETEMLALAPKAPFVGAAGQFEGYEQKWRTANTTNYAYLEYNPVIEGGVAAPPPQRVMPPMPSAGILQAKLGAAEDVKRTTGQYNASLGDKSNETSGIAIRARQREGDTSNFHYLDNLSRAMRYTGRQLVDLIPKIYNGRRIARIVSESGDTDQAQLDPEQAQAIQKTVEGAKSYNLSVGTYDVMVMTGPNYTTKRQETADMIAKILQTTPQLWPVIGDLLVKHMDWPGAQDIARRLQKMLPPQLQEPVDGKQPLPPQAYAAIQQAQQAMQAVQMKAQELAKVEKKLQSEATQTAVEKAALEEARTQLQAEKRVLDAEYQKLVAQLQAKMSEAACKEAQDAAGKAQETLERIATPTEGGSEYLTAAEMHAKMLAAVMQLVQQNSAPKQKNARITENPDGSFSMQAIEAPATVQ